jgi:predicted aspartyl protease
MQKALNAIQMQANSEEDNDPQVLQPVEQQEQDILQDDLMQISIAAYTGSPSASTISLLLSIQGSQAVALADTGSTNTFLDYNFVVKHNIPMVQAEARTVTVAGGRILTSTAIAPNCSFKIHDKQFCASFRILQLQGSDIILGVNWFKLHNPVTFDFLARTLTLGNKGDSQTFQDHLVPDTNLLISADECSKLIDQGATGYLLYLAEEVSESAPSPPSIPDVLAAIVEEFQDIFSEPTQLPPHRSADHNIPLIPGSKPPNI